MKRFERTGESGWTGIISSSRIFLIRYLARRGLGFRGMSVAFIRRRSAAVSPYRYRATAPKGRARSSRDAMTSAEVGSKAAPTEHPFPASRDCRRENYRRDTLTRRETVEARGRKDGRKRRKAKTGRASERASCRRSSCGYAVNHDEVP